MARTIETLSALAVSRANEPGYYGGGCVYLYDDGCGHVQNDISRSVAAFKRMGRDDITVHGFRSTFRDWCAESAANSLPREVYEHALLRQLPDKVEAAYLRGDLIEKRTVLMRVWADYCSKISFPDAVAVLPCEAA